MSDDELLTRLLAGELDPDESVVARRLAEDPVLAARWRSLAGLALRADELGRELAEGLATPSPAEDEVLAGFRDQLRARRPGATGVPSVGDVRGPTDSATGDAPPPTRPERPATWLPLLLVAATVLMAALLVIDDPGTVVPGPRPGESSLGPLDGLVPRGPGSSFEEFRWSATLPRGGWYRLDVWSVADDGSRTLVAEVEEWSEDHWEPWPEDVAAWGPRIVWRLAILGPGGLPVDAVEVGASR